MDDRVGPWHVTGNWRGDLSLVGDTEVGDRRVVWVTNTWGALRGSIWLVRATAVALDSLTEGLRALCAEAP